MAATFLPEVTLVHGARTAQVVSGDVSTVARGDALYVIDALPFVVLQVDLTESRLLLNRKHSGDDLIKVEAQTVPSVADIHRAAQALDGLYFQARSNIDNWQRLTQMTGDVTLALADGITITTPSLIDLVLTLWQQQQGKVLPVPTDVLSVTTASGEVLSITLTDYDTDKDYSMRVLLGQVVREAEIITYQPPNVYDAVVDLLVIEQGERISLIPIIVAAVPLSPTPEPTPIPAVIDQVPLVPLADVVSDLDDLFSP